MTISVLRTLESWWVNTPAGAVRIPTDATTTAELLSDRSAVNAAAQDTGTTPIGDLDLISPITKPCRVVAQATNFASHVRDTGGDPAKTPLTFFRKASGSIAGPYDDVVKPEHVQLLDYEAEIGLVIGRELAVGTHLTEANLAEFVCGLVLTNDVSARDIQMGKGQFFESKSYPTFTPIGPDLVLVDADELRRFEELRLQLRVNGEIRQDGIIKGDMLFQPLEALQGLTRFQELQPGDVVLTGTPVGTAIRAPKATDTSTPPTGKPTFEAFLASQADNPYYLHEGDLIEASAVTDDGTINLGVQRNKVRYA